MRSAILGWSHFWTIKWTLSHYKTEYSSFEWFLPFNTTTRMGIITKTFHQTHSIFKILITLSIWSLRFVSHYSIGWQILAKMIKIINGVRSLEIRLENSALRLNASANQVETFLRQTSQNPSKLFVCINYRSSTTVSVFFRLSARCNFKFNWYVTIYWLLIGRHQIRIFYF